jgi:hypothetical protein
VNELPAFKESEEKNMEDPKNFAERYVAVWNERDDRQRREQIAALWAEDGAHYIPSLEACGHAALEARIAGAHHKWVAQAGYVFACAGHAAGHHQSIKFGWTMGPAGGPVVSVGFDFVLLDASGKILADYQYIEA